MIVYWPSVAFILARVLAACTLVGFVLPLLSSSRHVWRAFIPLLFQTRRYEPGSIKLKEWKQSVRTGNPDRQLALLNKTDHQALSLSVEDYLALLKEIQPVFKAEPAISAYWEHRNRIEEALRQERRG